MRKKKTPAPLAEAKLYTLCLYVWMSAFYAIKHADDDCHYIYQFASHISKGNEVKSAFILHFFETYSSSDLTAN